LLQRLDPPGRSVEAANASRSQVILEVGVQKACDSLEIRRRLFTGRLDPRISSGFDLADE
jgi:hypothetical protein